jgi:dihydroxyacetone kinase-like protein
MQRVLDDPDEMVNGMLRGFLAAEAGRVTTTKHPRTLRCVHAPIPGKVGIVTGGGSGHKPAFIGYLGRGMCDAVAVGEIFTSPPASAFLEAFRAANSGAGVACLYGNYAGDNMNVKMAMELAVDERIEVRTVVANDDVASAPEQEKNMRRGGAGEILMWKVGAAMAAMGADLAKVIDASQRAIDCTRSIGIGLAPCAIPAVGHPNFAIELGMMEVGIGHHGEPGIRVVPLQRANEMARTMYEPVARSLELQSEDEVAVLVSGLGATPMMELYLLYGHIAECFRRNAITVHRAYVGNYFTSLDMNGVSLTVMKLDGQLKRCIEYPCDSVGLTQI